MNFTTYRQTTSDKCHKTPTRHNSHTHGIVCTIYRLLQLHVRSIPAQPLAGHSDN